MKSLPVGTAYSVWVGVGAGGTVVLGIVLLGEPANLARLISIALIIIGIIGLKFATGDDKSLKQDSPVLTSLHQGCCWNPERQVKLSSTA
jgi:hypothetical protein